VYLHLELSQHHMNGPHTIIYRRPSGSGAKPFEARRDAIPRPSAWVLLPVYLVWIGIFAASNAMPTSFLFGNIGLVMFLLIPVPYWAYRNWNDVVEDLPATYATIIVALVLIEAYNFEFWWTIDGVRSGLRLRILQAEYSWLLTVLDWISRCIFLVLIFCRRSLFRMIYTRLSKISSVQAEQECAPNDL